VVVFPFVHFEADIQLKRDRKEVLYSEFINLSAQNPDRDTLHFEQLPFNHPLFIMYSSGTTGKPKCIVHGAGGTLMKHLEEHQIQGNRSPEDVLLYYTTVGNLNTLKHVVRF
jgi:acetoacetyl-CoA synthetase